MDPSVLQRMRGRRARARASQENLVKDSSSDVSPRESSSSIAERRRQRRAHRSPNTQEYDNQAFAEDEQPLPPPIERDDDEQAEEEEENIQNADRLVSHVAKQHRRIVNEIQQQNKKSKKKPTTTTESDDVEQDQDLQEQIREGQEILSKRAGDAPEVHDGDDDDGRATTIEPMTSTTKATRDKSIESILERAKKSRLGRSIDDDQQTTMGSSRRFGTSSEMKLQRFVRQHDTRIDASQIVSPTGGDRSTRFDYEARDEQIRKEINAKREDRTNRWKKAIKKVEELPPPSEQDDFFLKIWPEEKPEVKPPPAEPAEGDEPKTTDATVPIEESVTALAEKMPLLPVYGEAQLTQYQRAEREFDDDEERDFENEKLKYVIGEEISLQQKLGEGIVEPRSLEDEGIFVGKKPIVPTTVVHRAEKRILQECQIDKKPIDRWFGPDGAVTSLPDPTKFVPTRPLMDDLFDPALSREFYKAYVADSTGGLASDPIGADRYRLDIDLGTIAFLHHHYMNIEHVFAMKMKQMYEHYTVRTQQRIVQQLSEKIKALKTAENNCRTLYEQNRYSDSTLPQELHNRLLNYQNELRQTRNQRCNEMRLDRQLLERLLSTWKKIKDVRKTNGYVTTSVRLLIKQISGKKSKHYEQMQQQIEEEIEDEIKLADEEYQRQKNVYADVVKKRKLQAIRKKEARKRLDKKRDQTGADDGEYDEGDIAILNEDEILLPEKPEPRKHDEIRTIILMKYQNAVRPPDEPEILLELVYSEQISTDAECSAREQDRRHRLQTSGNILARILINDKIMADTPAVPLNNEFEGSFSQIYPCYIVNTPQTIKIQLFESSARFRSPLVELYLPIPEPTITSENYKLQAYEFSSNILRQFPPQRTTAIGAGMPTPIQIDDSERIYLNIEGFLNVGVAWGVQDGVVLVPPDYATSKAFQNRLLAGGVKEDISMQAAYLNNMKHLAEWIKQSNLDPYDPENAFLINLMKDYTGSSDTHFPMNTLQHFRLWIDENDETEQQRRQAELDNSLRFKLFQARKENIPYFKDYKYVPAYDYLVRKEHGIFKKYMARQQETVEEEELEQQYPEKRQTRIDAVRKQGEQQLRKMREQVLARFTLTSGRKSYHQMVIEESIPNIQALSGFLASLYIEPARPLYPAARRPEQKKVMASNLAMTTNRDVVILVNIISAIDLPVRRAALEAEKTKLLGRDKNAERLSLIRPYVEIQFQKNTYRTSTVDGPNPSWNEELRIPFRPPDNDFDASSLQRCRDILYINIFDQLDVDLPTTDRERGKVIRKRIERNWLGSVKIPFSNIYVNGRLEGSYRVNVPNPLLGYAREKLTQTRMDPASKEVPASVLRMFVTMDPILAPPETIQQSFDSTESPELLSRAHHWAEELHKKFPNRDYKVTVSDINGRAVFIPRFLRPLTLPPLSDSAMTTDGGTNNQTQCQRLARFVSLIPFLSDTITFPGICDIWETSDQFLKTMAGDDEEHAVLLNNYFRSLNKKSWIAMGLSIYSGPCCFVLTKEDNERDPICWSVADGYDASTRDTWNPIRSIYLLANEENVWANIQKQDLPSRMEFDVNNTKNWKPFSDPSKVLNTPPPISVQPNELHYEITQIEDVRSLERHINDILRNKFMEWRGSYVTSWHWSCQKILQDIIKQKETTLVSGRTPTTPELESALADIQITHDINGFPLHMPYSNVKTIVDTVYSTKIFEHSTNDIEFALAVHVYPYPNNILAVWIYLANLTKKKL